MFMMGYSKKINSTNPHISENLGEVGGLCVKSQVIKNVGLQALQARIQTAEGTFLGFLVLFATIPHLPDQLGERLALGIDDSYGIRSVLQGVSKGTSPSID